MRAATCSATSGLLMLDVGWTVIHWILAGLRPQRADGGPPSLGSGLGVAHRSLVRGGLRRSLETAGRLTRRQLRGWSEMWAMCLVFCQNQELELQFAWLGLPATIRKLRHFGLTKHWFSGSLFFIGCCDCPVAADKIEPTRRFVEIGLEDKLG